MAAVCAPRPRLPRLGDAEAEAELGATFPGEIRSLYLTSDGVFDEPGQWFVIWPVAELISRNQACLGYWKQHPPGTAGLRRRRHRGTLLHLARRRS